MGVENKIMGESNKLLGNRAWTRKRSTYSFVLSRTHQKHWEE
jgi:hypothetical protein